MTNGAVGQTRMAKEAGKPGRPRSDRDDVTVRLSRDLAEKALEVARLRGVPVAAILDPIVKRPLERLHAKTLAEMGQAPG